MLEEWIRQGIGAGVTICCAGITILVVGCFVLGIIGAVANALEVARKNGNDGMRD